MRNAFILASSLFFALFAYSTAFACNARVVRSSTAIVLADDDCAVGIEHSAAQRVTLPPHPENGGIIEIDDLAGNFQQAVTVILPNKGQRVAQGNPTGAVELNEDGMSWRFRFFATGTDTGIWSMDHK